MYREIPGLDYEDIFSLVAKITFFSVRLLICLAAINHWVVHLLNINDASGHSELHNELSQGVYTEQSQSLLAPGSQLVSWL